MQTVGVKELKDKLTYYLKIVREGGRVVVTDRGKPVAILHSLDQLEADAGAEERLASAARKNLVRLPCRKGGLGSFRAAEAGGRPASEIILEERR